MELVVAPNHVFGPFLSTVLERAVHTGSSHLTPVVVAIPYVPLMRETPIAAFALSAPAFRNRLSTWPTSYRISPTSCQYSFGLRGRRNRTMISSSVCVRACM